MNNKKITQKSYVFSQRTLELALQEWLELSIKKNKKNAESYKITAVAMPWFLKHIDPNARIYMFTYDDLHTEMKVWKSAQIASYSKQKERINETCNQLLDFFQSDTVVKYKMIIDA